MYKRDTENKARKEKKREKGFMNGIIIVDIVLDILLFCYIQSEKSVILKYYKS